MVLVAGPSQTAAYVRRQYLSAWKHGGLRGVRVAVLGDVCNAAVRRPDVATLRLSRLRVPWLSNLALSEQLCHSRGRGAFRGVAKDFYRGVMWRSLSINALLQGSLYVSAKENTSSGFSRRLVALLGRLNPELECKPDAKALLRARAPSSQAPSMSLCAVRYRLVI